MAHDFVAIEATREWTGLDRPVREIFMTTNTRGGGPHSTVGAVIDTRRDLPRHGEETARAVRNGG